MKLISSAVISIYYLFIALVISGIISGCGENKSSVQKANKIAIEDMTGRSVMIPQPKYIQRVAVLTSSEVLAAYVVGVNDKLCGVTDSVKNCALLNMYDPHLKKVPAVISQAGQVDNGALIKAEPDIVIGSESDLGPVENGSGLTTLRINSATAKGSISHLRDEIRFIGSVFGREEKAEQYVVYLDNILSLIKFSLADMPAEKRLRIFAGFNADHLGTYGSGTFMDECIRAAGCVNAAESVSSTGGKDGGAANLSMEQVLGFDPDIIVIDSGSPDDLLSDPSWSKLKAVQNKMVYRLPKGLFVWNNASCESAVMVPQWLAVTAYPDKLNFLDISDRVREFYARNFNFQLTDNIIHNILNPS